MTGHDLQTDIRALLSSHPNVWISELGDTAHAERYVTTLGNPIGLEPDRKSFQNLWVRADSVNLSKLKDIEHIYYHHWSFDLSNPNHNLFGEPSFKDCDLVRFKVVDLWQGVRIISEVAGLG